MLETLVSSRIRRALFEYVLKNPSERFYLRGLAKELDLSVSPLRRELLRHVQSGMLRTIHEGNMVFYTVNADSPVFKQLRQAVEAPAGEAPASTATALMEPPAPSIAQPSVAAPLPAAATPLVAVAESSQQDAQVSSLTNPLQTPMLLMVTSLGLVVMVVAAALFYLSITRQQAPGDLRAAAKASTARQLSKPSLTSGIMQGQQWRLTPGGFGGFAAGARGEAR